MTGTVFDVVQTRELIVEKILIKKGKRIPFIDEDGFTMASIDEFGNLHIRGDVLKDL